MSLSLGLDTPGSLVFCSCRSRFKQVWIALFCSREPQCVQFIEGNAVRICIMAFRCVRKARAARQRLMRWWGDSARKASLIGLAIAYQPEIFCPTAFFFEVVAPGQATGPAAHSLSIRWSMVSR